MARELRPFQREDGEYVSRRFATLVAHEPRVGKTNIAIHGSDLGGAEIIDNGRGKPLSWSAFRDKYCKMINTPFGAKIAGSKNYKELRQKLDGFVIRRKRSDVFGRDMLPPSRVYVRAKPTDAKELDALM